MVQKISFENKEGLQNDADVPAKSKVTDADINEIKNVVNANADDLDNLHNTFQTVTNSALNYKGNVSTYNNLSSIQSPSEGDIYTVLDEGKNYAFNGEGWFFFNNTADVINLSKSSGGAIETIIVANTDYTLPFSYKVGNDSLEVYYCSDKLIKGIDYIEVGDIGSISNTIQFTDTLGDLNTTDIDGLENFKETLEFVVRR